MHDDVLFFNLNGIGCGIEGITSNNPPTHRQLFDMGDGQRAYQSLII
jgi:hypothetical protein